MYTTAMLTTYNKIIGAAKMHMFKTSVVGVTMAAIMKMIKIEYRKFFHKNDGLIIPIKPRKNARIGNSKIAPSPIMMVRNRSVYSPIVIIGLNCRLYPIRKSSAAGNAILNPNNPPAINKPTVEIMNGITYRFSCR